MIFRVCQWLYSLSVSQTIREADLVFPVLECIHLYSMVCLITVIAMFDVRLMGFVRARVCQPISQLAKLVMLLAWICFGVNAATGSFLFISKATDYYANGAFRVKILLVFMGIVYHTVILRRKWDEEGMSMGAKLTGAFSLALWIGVIGASRWIAYADV